MWPIFIFPNRQFCCHPPDDHADENVKKLAVMYIKFCVQQITKISNGSLVKDGNQAAVLNDLDHFFQALVKLFQVHFYLAERSKKSQVWPV